MMPMKTFPVIKDLVTDVSWNYHGEQEDSAVSAEAGNRLEVLSGRCRPGAGVSQVHRVLLVPERVPRSCAIMTRRSSSAGRDFSCAWRGWRCTRSMASPATKLLKDESGHRLLQHHEMLHGGLSGGHSYHRQRHHSAEGARRGSLLRSAGVDRAKDRRGRGLD